MFYSSAVVAVIANEPSLHLLLDPGHGHGWSGASGYHGNLYVARKFTDKNPGIDETNQVDILCSQDRIRMVMMIENNGPIYVTTNSGTSWTVFNMPGKYEFRVTGSDEEGGFLAAATIEDVPDLGTKPKVKDNWYSVVSAPNGSKLVLTGGSSQSAPALSIIHSGNGVIISWPSSFPNFSLQQNIDLTTTNWIDVTNSVNAVGEENQVIISPAVDNNFYRLKSQSP